MQPWLAPNNSASKCGQGRRDARAFFDTAVVPSACFAGLFEFEGIRFAWLFDGVATEVGLGRLLARAARFATSMRGFLGPGLVRVSAGGCGERTASGDESSTTPIGSPKLEPMQGVSPCFGTVSEPMGIANQMHIA